MRRVQLMLLPWMAEPVELHIEQVMQGVSQLAKVCYTITCKFELI